MKRALVIALVLAAAAVSALAGCGGNDGYRVRAIFMNAFSVIPGEDVKIAGVKVGKIESLDVTPDQRAAVVLRITKPGFDDFRQDAECTIRPQSLIGEKFVECTPTQPRPEGAQEPPPLRKIQRGEGKGQYLLPVTNTSKPVDLDLINNTLRLPYRQRLTIILNELGTGLAGRGADLRQAIRNANPALKETDRVLAILAAQNRVLANLARDGDAILAPLARDRASVAGFVVNANTTAQATAERSRDLQQDIAKLPAFLRQLTPTANRLGALADQMTPVLTDLGVAAPDVNRFVAELGPFSTAGIPAFQSLGEAADVGGPALVKSKPLIDELGQFGSAAVPLSKNLASLLTSFRDTGGIEQLMNFLYFSTTAVNGFDSVGHYLRASLILNACTTYALTPQQGCNANWPAPESSSGSNARAASGRGASYNDKRRSDDLRKLDAYMHGVDLDVGSQAKSPAKPAAARKAAPPKAVPAAAMPARGRGGSDPAQTLLDYLLGDAG
jgi:phospholipid/cholesterol/gamma-HCH transport system substrate-binding protein